jgi:hypothetical protein
MPNSWSRVLYTMRFTIVSGSVEYMVAESSASYCILASAVLTSFCSEALFSSSLLSSFLLTKNYCRIVTFFAGSHLLQLIFC